MQKFPNLKDPYHFLATLGGLGLSPIGPGTVGSIFGWATFIVLAHLAIKSFDLVIALTGGGPGYATDLPATYMYTMAFSRGDIGQAASSAIIMMIVVFSVVVPYLYSELRNKNDQ